MPENQTIRLWPDGPPTKLEGVGTEAEYRAPVGVATNALMLRNVSAATLTVYRPEKPNGIGIIVVPGGGWRILAWEHEGTDVVKWLTALGYTAFLLKYRVRGTPQAQADYEAELMQMASKIDLSRSGKTAFCTIGEVVPFEDLAPARAAAADDGRRAVEIVRSHAKEWDIDPA